MSTLDRNRILRTPDDVGRLATRLADCREVAQFDAGDHKEGFALACSFADIESEFRRFLDEALPRLATSSGEELPGLLFEIGVHFQHILYHVIEQQEFYKYLVPKGTTVFGPPSGGS